MAQLKSTIINGDLSVTEKINGALNTATLETGDFLPIIDTSDLKRLRESAITFNTANTTVWLTQAGTWTTPTATNIGLGSVSNNATLNGVTGTIGDMIYWSAANTPARLAKGAASTVLRMGSSNIPTWQTTYTKSSAGDLEWTSGNAANEYLITKNALAYWDGRYRVNNTPAQASNLAYCNKGAFGTIVTKATTDYIALDSSNNATISGIFTASNLTAQPRIKVSSGAGNIYLYSEITATGKRGIYSANAAGTGTNILTIDQDNLISLHKQVHLIDASIITDMSTVTKGVAPTGENQYRTLEWHDVNGSRLAQVEYGALTNGESRLNLYVLEASTGTTNTGYGGIVIRKYVGNDGNFVAIFNANTGNFSANTVSGAVWNDYAEYRTQLEKIEPGRAIKDLDDGHVVKTEERLIPGAQVVSDTFGFALGETNNCQTPVAVSGRVLVYPYRNRYEYHAGMAVCSAPNGTVDIMTREEIQKYPDAIVGIVSEIPEYEEWGQDPIKVNNRIWIKVK